MLRSTISQLALGTILLYHQTERRECNQDTYYFGVQPNNSCDPSHLPCSCAVSSKVAPTWGCDAAAHGDAPRPCCLLPLRPHFRVLLGKQARPSLLALWLERSSRLQSSTHDLRGRRVTLQFWVDTYRIRDARDTRGQVTGTDTSLLLL